MGSQFYSIQGAIKYRIGCDFENASRQNSEKKFIGLLIRKFVLWNKKVANGSEFQYLSRELISLGLYVGTFLIVHFLGCGQGILLILF